MYALQVVFCNYKRPQHQYVYIRPVKAVISFLRGVDYRFATDVERSVYQNRYAGEIFKRVKQFVIFWILIFVNYLHAGGTVLVSDCRDDALFFWMHLRRKEHV